MTLYNTTVTWSSPNDMGSESHYSNDSNKSIEKAIKSLQAYEEISDLNLTLDSNHSRFITDSDQDDVQRKFYLMSKLDIVLRELNKKDTAIVVDHAEITIKDNDVSQVKWIDQWRN